MVKPDRTEKGIRFGCGFAFGLFVGFLAAARYMYHSAGWLATVAFATALLCGWLAMRCGDEFWESLRHWWWF